MKKFAKALLAATIAAGATQANAALYNFDFTGDGIYDYHNSRSYTQGDLSLGVTAFAKNDNGTTEARKVATGPLGLGVYGSAWIGNADYDTTKDIDGHNVVGDYSNEYIKFDFSKEVLLKSIRFTAWDKTDKAVVYEVDSTGWHQVGSLGGGLPGDILGREQLVLDNTGGNGKGQVFTVLAADFTAWWSLVPSTDFRISGLTVDHTPVVVPPTKVPEPLTLGLLGAGLAALGLSRRRAA